jgi:hypothetical protein
LASAGCNNLLKRVACFIARLCGLLGLGILILGGARVRLGLALTVLRVLVIFWNFGGILGLDGIFMIFCGAFSLFFILSSEIFCYEKDLVAEKNFCL